MLFRSLPLVAVALGLTLLAGCAADTDSTDADTNDDEGEVTDDLVSGKKFHYAPLNASVIWKPGCGVRPPNGTVCESGLFLEFTRKYIDLQVTQSGSYNAATNTLTVKLDTWSKSKTHPKVLVALMPQEEPVKISGAGTPIRFKVKLVDYNGTQLFAGSIAAIPAP